MSSIRRSWSLFLMLSLAALATGCAAARREAWLQGKTKEHVYNKQLAEVWPEVRALLKEKGFALREAPGSAEIATEWLQTSPPSNLGTTWARYLVRGQQPTPATCSFEFLRQNRTVSGTNSADMRSDLRTADTGQSTANMVRDLELEWELLQRLEPETAKGLRAEAEQQFK